MLQMHNGDLRMLMMQAHVLSTRALHRLSCMMAAGAQRLYCLTPPNITDHHFAGPMGRGGLGALKVLLVVLPLLLWFTTLLVVILFGLHTALAGVMVAGDVVAGQIDRCVLGRI